MRILLVDDNADMLESLQILLETMGFEARGAADGASALAEAARFEPDVAVIDISLPDISGLELAGRLRASAARPLRLVAFSGHGSPEDIRRSLAAGFDEHLVKPVDLDQLVAALG